MSVLVSVLVSVRFEIACVLLHLAALSLITKPLGLQGNETDARRCGASGSD